jgi:hypothetical protein
MERTGKFSLVILFFVGIVILTDDSVRQMILRTVSSSSIIDKETTETTSNNHGHHHRRPPGTADCLVFFHICKTAGSLFKDEYLKPLSKPHGWVEKPWYGYLGPKRRKQDPPRPGPYNVSMFHSGHYNRHFLNVTKTERCKIMTILREPVDRAISAFYYHGHKTPEWDDCLFSDNANEHCLYAYQYSNDIVRLLAGQAPTWDSYEIDVYRSVPVNETSVRLAQEFLLDMDLVCFQDRLDECRRQTEALLGFNSSKKYTDYPIGRKNVNHQRPKNLTDIVLNKVRAMNRWDIKLYDWALQQQFDVRRPS